MEIAAVMAKKILGQLTYLSPENVCLALWDDQLAYSDKKAIAKKILSRGNGKEDRIITPVPIPVAGKCLDSGVVNFYVRWGR